MELDFDSLQTPALLVDLDRVEHNIRRTLTILGDDATRWRPHLKTSKIPEVFDLLLAAGVAHFKCATTKEARCLLGRAPHGIDLLVAMAHRGANLRGVEHAAREFGGHRVSVLAEDPEHAREIRAAGSGSLGIFVDLNPGYHRTGIPLDDRDRIFATIEASGPALAGLHFYDGHLHDRDRGERERIGADLYGAFAALADEVGQRWPGHGHGLELVTSGTPSFEVAAEFSGFRGRDHKVSPGTVVYWDTTSEGLGIEGYRYAVSVLATVISRPRSDRVTCDAGSKAVDAASGDPCCIVQDWPTLRALKPSEEHLPLHIESGDAPSPGSRLRLVPRHVCPTVNLADQAVLVRDGRIQGIVPVAARGHDTLPC